MARLLASLTVFETVNVPVFVSEYAFVTERPAATNTDVPSLVVPVYG